MLAARSWTSSRHRSPATSASTDSTGQHEGDAGAGLVGTLLERPRSLGAGDDGAQLVDTRAGENDGKVVQVRAALAD
jgi:hypothetical protein